MLRTGRQHVHSRHRKRVNGSARPLTFACMETPCAGTGRSSGRPSQRWRFASGRRRAVADDPRTEEIRLSHSSYEAGEQDRANGGGVDGAKGTGQEENGPAKRAPDSEPGKRV